LHRDGFVADILHFIDAMGLGERAAGSVVTNESVILIALGLLI
jgi:hypothetical protein